MSGEPAAVSVVMNFLNAERFIDDAVASVYAQSYPHWELLLIDDGSTDASTTIARRLADRDPERVRYLEHPGHENRGASAARNLGMREARYGLIAFLDSDDVWFTHRLARGVELFASHAQVAMVYGRSLYWHSWQDDRQQDRIQSHGIAGDRVIPAPELLVDFLLELAALPSPTSVMVHRDSAVACGGWVDSFRGMYDDQAFFARLCLHHDVYVANDVWDRYRQHDRSLCATAERLGEVPRARRTYLAWLRAFLDTQGMRGTRVWEALRYAERAEPHQRPGLRARLTRKLLRSAARTVLRFRPAQGQLRARSGQTAGDSQGTPPRP